MAMITVRIRASSLPRLLRSLHHQWDRHLQCREAPQADTEDICNLRVQASQAEVVESMACTDLPVWAHRVVLGRRNRLA